VVGVAVGDGDGVEAGDAAGPQIRGYYVFAEVELGAGSPSGAAGVD
jgi:hypothetical protein